MVSFSEVIIPASKVEAAAIKCFGKHKHKRERGTASCRGWHHGDSESANFRTSRRGTYRVKLRRLIPDMYTVTVTGRCGASASADVEVKQGVVKVRIDY